MVAVAPRATAQPDARIEGELVDQSGAPLPGAVVVVRTTPDARVAASTTTARDGRFAFRSLVLGDYVIEATLDGFAPVSQRVTVVPDQVAQLRLVASLARQIKGTLTVQNGPGVSFRIDFKELAYVAR